MKHKASVIIAILLVLVVCSLCAATVIPQNAVKARLTFTAAFYSGSDGEKHYNTNYWVSSMTDIKAFREIWFKQLFESPAYADLYDKDRNFIGTIPHGQYGEIIHYILPQDACYICLHVKREDLSDAALFGRKRAVNTISVGNEMKTINNAEETPLDNIITDGGMFGTYNKGIREACSLFTENIYPIEMDIYAIERQDWESTLGHGNTMGYLNYSYQISSYVDWNIRRYPDDFKYVQFIGTPYEYSLGLVKQ